MLFIIPFLLLGTASASPVETIRPSMTYFLPNTLPIPIPTRMPKLESTITAARRPLPATTFVQVVVRAADSEAGMEEEDH